MNNEQRLEFRRQLMLFLLRAMASHGNDEKFLEAAAKMENIVDEIIREILQT